MGGSKAVGGWEHGQAKTARVGLQHSKKLGEGTRAVEKEKVQGTRGSGGFKLEAEPGCR